MIQTLKRPKRFSFPIAVCCLHLLLVGDAWGQVRADDLAPRGGAASPTVEQPTHVPSWVGHHAKEAATPAKRRPTRLPSIHPSPAANPTATATLLEPERRFPEPNANANRTGSLLADQQDRSSIGGMMFDFDPPGDASTASLRLGRAGRHLRGDSACDDCSDPESACDESANSSQHWADFSATPVPECSMYHDAGREAWVYDAKRDVPTQHPWVEWGRIFYGDGITPRGRNWFGDKNMVRPQFYLYGDYRYGIASGRNAVGRTDNSASRLNLDLDLRLTDTERFHAFVGPLDEDNQFTGFERVDGDWRFRNRIDFTPVTGYFEGDLGVMLGAARGKSSPMELPFTIGLVPLLFQNGIWMEDAVTGAAFSLPARHSKLLNWSNYDATFFAVFDQLNSPAFGADNHAAQAFGTAWFIEAYDGYIESGYAFVNDRNQSDRSYHNVTFSYTRRYFDRISNSVRVIVNAGQDLADADTTADGVLLLVENSWITRWPLTVVPYANFFVGWDRPQSVARAGGSGGILRNTGINFDTDGLNGLATIDPTASDTAGGSLGIDLIGDDLDRQLLLEIAYQSPHGSKNPRVPDDQFAAGARYQFPISHRTLLRFDAMYGWRRGLEDVYGTRMEYRWKF